MNHKKLLRWVALVLAAVGLLLVLILIGEPKKGKISRAAVYKSVALLKADRGDVERLQAENGSHFPAQERNNWYVKYMDYLYSEGILSESETSPDKETAQGWMTYGEVESIVRRLYPSLAGTVGATGKNSQKPYPSENWWLFYESLKRQLDADGNVKEQNVIIYGTPANVKDSAAWTAYTNLGIMGFEGLGMDSYIDRELKILYRGTEIISVKSVVSDTVTYRNIWLMRGGDGNFQFYLGQVKRELPIEKSMGEPEEIYNNLADLTLKNGKLKKVKYKRERITGKILSVKENSIEIENYGTLKLDEDFKIYRIYGQFREQKMSDILVGYDLQEFVVAKGKLCAALTVREFQAKTIRVLLMDGGYHSVFHPSATLSSDTGMILSDGKSEEEIEAGQEFTISPEDSRLKEGRIVLRPKSQDGTITVKSIERAQGTPSYSGILEITGDQNGLLLTNELYLEDYLTKVVPSEMSGSYEIEALKAQAVCARTYAYRQIQGGGYSGYGAHVDDSTRYQVYNNISSDPKTAEAVRETYGKMLYFNGIPIEAFYFSTSCGHTTDGSVWGGDPASVPYLKGVTLRDSRETMDLTDNEVFSAFIKDRSFASYDSSFPMYRWETRITGEQASEKIGGIGKIVSLEIIDRGVGGVAKKLRAVGESGEQVISGENQIREKLGSSSLVITNNSGKEMSGMETLPSAFLTVEKVEGEDGEAPVFHIFGGGYGHGAGMSQNGAQAMAREGKKYEDILKFFYDGVEIKEAGE